MTEPSDSYQRPTLWQTALPHLVLLAMAIGIIAISFAMRVGDADSESVYLPWMDTPLPPSCSARLTLGISCPGCGLTRSFIAISHGQLQRAWNLNAASFLIYSFVLVQIPWHLFQINRIRKNVPTVRSLWIYFPLIACAVALVLQWIVRMSMGIRVV